MTKPLFAKAGTQGGGDERAFCVRRKKMVLQMRIVINEIDWNSMRSAETVKALTTRSPERNRKFPQLQREIAVTTVAADHASWEPRAI
ncbi:hypothetical protein [Cupriavidus neocaledonicus]|uniref:hypothetical protein n=1 Tax=Cupriavidus neocaledonicus TaxID=1040979 RepID=UPI0011AE3D25|nr:hypothetical protein [Cupriavidus neocaledonicus]